MPSGFSPQRAIREPQGVPNKRVVRAVSLISSLGLGSRKREALQRGFLSLVLICEMIEETRSRWTVPSFLLPRNTEAPWAWQTFRKKKAWSWLALSIAYRSGESELRKIVFEIWGYPDYERNFTKFGGLLRNARELLNCAQIFTCECPRLLAADQGAITR